MKAFWHCVGINNYGDVLPVYVMQKLHGITLQWSNTDDEPLFMFSGSCMAEVKPNVVASCLGFNYITDRCAHVPYKLVSVRGPLTREILLGQGIECPEKYFDFVKLLPNLFRKTVNSYGTIYVPHYVDTQLLMQDKAKTVIDICSGVEQVTNFVLRAEKVITGSLHICMLCEEFGIDYEFAHPINEIAGDGMKYEDYFASIGKKFVSTNI